MFAWAQPGVNKLLMNVNSNFFSKFLKVSGNFEKYGFCKISTHGFFPSCRAKQHQCWSLMYIVQTLMDQIAHTWHLYTGPFSSCSANNILPFATGLATLGRLARSLGFQSNKFFQFCHPGPRCPLSSSMEAANMNSQAINEFDHLTSEKLHQSPHCQCQLESRMFDWWNNYKIKQIWFISLM